MTRLELGLSILSGFLLVSLIVMIILYFTNQNCSNIEIPKTTNSKNSANAKATNSTNSANYTDAVASKKIDDIFSDIFKIVNNNIDKQEIKNTLIAEINDKFNILMTSVDNPGIVSIRNKFNDICKNNVLNISNIYEDNIDDRVNEIYNLNENDIKDLMDKIDDFILYTSKTYFCDGDTFNIDKLRKTIIKYIEYYYNVNYDNLSVAEKNIIKKPILKFLYLSK